MTENREDGTAEVDVIVESHSLDNGGWSLTFLMRTNGQPLTGKEAYALAYIDTRETLVKGGLTEQDLTTLVEQVGPGVPVFESP